ncbi:larval cuticle protein 2 [Stomoxys calcitrans]|uniref:larval cuticle protein 2 n=1 Tax=Stomoxys calcitrans TaxID=35570 RepID=UPI0027E23792|nr:larval cuticle protein 2 [Stomoxys calcitrans]
MFKIIALCTLLASASALSTFGKHNSGGNGGGHSSASSDDVHAEVKSYTSDVRPDGFEYAYDTTNAINSAASGDAYGNVHGDFGWVSPEGVHVALQYTADENGYQPNSDILPTPPPIPAAILKALEYIRTHPPKEESNSYHAASSNNRNSFRHF